MSAASTSTSLHLAEDDTLTAEVAFRTVGGRPYACLTVGTVLNGGTFFFWPHQYRDAAKGLRAVAHAIEAAADMAPAVEGLQALDDFAAQERAS